MGAWGTAIFSDDLALDIKHEYNTLLSFGKTNEETENLLKDYYNYVFQPQSEDESIFWYALAWSEWKKGRLSEETKEKALMFIDNKKDLKRWENDKKKLREREKVLGNLKKVLLSEMPEKKKICKPAVHHCPWKVGSLLAYRITTYEELRNDPLYNKYVLLRVVEIGKQSLSAILPNEFYDETMLVGLYDWIGDEIPSPDIVNKLDYIPIEDYIPEEQNFHLNMEMLNNVISDRMSCILKNAFSSLTDRQIVKCVQLNWTSHKKCNDTITLIDFDTEFENHIPDFFKSGVNNFNLTNFKAFDITLINRFKDIQHS